VRDVVLVLLLAALTDGARYLLLTLGRAQENVPVTVTLRSDRPGLARGGGEQAQLLAQVQALGWSLQFQQTSTEWITTITLPAAGEAVGTNKEEPR
jgi:hypothetical protein